MLDLSVTELRLIGKNRGIKGYKNLDKDELLKTFLFSSLSLDELRSISKSRKIKKICLIFSYYENMSENELLDAFRSSGPFKDSNEIRKENRDDVEIVRDIRVLYEAKEDYYEPRKMKKGF